MFVKTTTGVLVNTDHIESISLELGTYLEHKIMLYMINGNRYTHSTYETSEEAKLCLESIEVSINGISIGKITSNKEIETILLVDTKEKRKKYGKYKHVLLTDTEVNNLKKDYPKVDFDKLIEYFDGYIEEKGYKSKSHNLAIRRWVIEAMNKKPNQGYRVGKVELVTDYSKQEEELTKGIPDDFDYEEYNKKWLEELKKVK